MDRDRQLDAEVQSHLEQSVRDHMDRGLSRRDAEAAARREFGNVGLVKEVTREMWGWASLERLWHDLRFGSRMLAKSPAFTLVAVLTLALGIGANAAIFSIVYGVLLRPLPFAGAERLANVYLHFAPQNNPRGNMSLMDYVDWKAQNRAFVSPGIFANGVQELTGEGEPVQVLSTHVTANFFSILGVAPMLGRTFADGEDTGSSAQLAVISEDLWRRRFHSDPGVIGKVIMSSGNATTIVGVMPASFAYPRQNTDIWLCIHVAPKRRGPYAWVGIARLKPGVTFEQAQAETNTIGARIAQANPGSYSKLEMPVWKLRDAMVGNVRPALVMIFGAVGFVLLIAMANVANLILSRSTARRREMAVRLGLGATRIRIVRQLLTESVLLGLLGAGAGLLLAYACMSGFRAWNPTQLLPRVASVQLDGTVVAFTIVLSLVSSVLFGLIPALRMVDRDFQVALKEGGRSGTSSASSQRTHGVLAVAEIALSVVLVAGAGLLIRSLIAMQSVDTGVGAAPRSILSMNITATGAKYRDEKAGIAFYQRVLEQVRALPGVEAAGMSDARPPDWHEEDDTFNIQGVAWDERAYPSTVVAHVAPGYFEALRIPLLRGRYIGEQDRRDSPPVVVISQSLARRYFGNEDPLGHHLQQSQPAGNTSPRMEIVGVVGDVKYWGLDSSSQMAYYEPVSQVFTPGIFLFVRSATPAASLAPEIERTIHGIDPDCTITTIRTLDEAIYESVAQPRFRTLLLGAFAAMALLLAAIGVYGVIAYSVAQRTQEFGIRMALGAARSDVVRLVMSRGFAIGGSGVLIGLAASLLLTRTLQRFLFGVTATDPLTFAAVALGLWSIALLACYLPARRATRVEPTVALRYE